MDKPVARALSCLNEVLKGKYEVIRLGVASLLARGHLLLEDLPGTGKTTFATAMARVFGCQFKRVQFTNDLLPADILGTEIYLPAEGRFEIRPGPIFTNFFLADELNRASPRTQSALLEAMGEGRVSLGGETLTLPQPFFVIATQNPLEQHGTFPLPESQLDRFLMRLRLGYPEREEEAEILLRDGFYEKARDLPQIVSMEDLLRIQNEVRKVKISPKVVDYLLDIAWASREERSFLFGFSTRGLLALKRAAQAVAYLSGRDFVIPDDVKSVFLPVAYHRLPLTEEVEGLEREECLRLFLSDVPVPV
ncbi:MAG: MoxR family ATPase [Thermodesulfobacteria bacterium]|nr:MoxR family ATPase [Thermodesulfobacteriota bacterium]